MNEDKIFNIVTRVEKWMEDNTKNEWVQMCGAKWLRKLMDKI